MIHLPQKKDDPRCSCVTGQYECGFCQAISRQRIWNNMSEKDRDYDRYVDPANSLVLDSGRALNINNIERGCSCHINPPCSWCTDSENPQNQQEEL